MLPEANAVQGAAQFMTPGVVSAPRCGAVVFTVLHGVHKLWRVWRCTKTYGNAQNAAALLGGHFANAATRNGGMISSTIREAAFWTMAMHRLTMCVEQHVVFYQTCCQVSDSAKNRYPLYERTTWEKNPSSKFISPSTRNWLHETWRSTVNYVYRLFMSIIMVPVQAFILSMRIMDVLELLSPNPYLYDEAMQEFSINAMEGLEVLTRNQERLLTTYRKYKPITTKMLGDGVANNLEGMMVSSIQGAKSVHGTLKSAGGVVRDVLKGMLFTAATLVHLTDQIPQSLRLTGATPFQERAVTQLPKVYTWPLPGKNQALTFAAG